MKQDTVGKASLELQQKTPESRDPIELEREMHKDYEKNILECIETNKKLIHGSFYVVVITKCEPLLPNVFRNYFFAAQACPTPDYDQAVYRFDAGKEIIEFLWVVPTKQVCEIYREHAMEIVHHERELLQLVLDFYDGTLLKIAKKLNGECESSPLLEK